jgi:hypothetical protein
MHHDVHYVELLEVLPHGLKRSEYPIRLLACVNTKWTYSKFLRFRDHPFESAHLTKPRI